MKGDKLTISYEKRKNSDLFRTLERENGLFLSNIQNYSPIYNRFFLLNDTNCKSINLNNVSYILEVQDNISEQEENPNLFECMIRNSKSGKSLQKEVFFKMAPLLDPYKYLIGKYNHNDNNLFNLPNYNSVQGEVHPKILDVNNSSYVDGLFTFLSSLLIYHHNFLHGVDYYGSLLAIKNNFKVNVVDDIEYLCKSDFFNKHKNTELFSIQEYGHLIQHEQENIRPILKIDNSQHNESNKSNLSIESINDNLYEELFDNSEEPVLSLDDLKDSSLELIDINDTFLSKNSEFKSFETTAKSNSTCSSRTSHTSLNTENDNNDNNDNNDKNKSSSKSEQDEDEDEEDENDSEEEDEEEEEDEDDEEETLYSTIPKFPVQVICMENCDSTFDELIMTEDLSHEEWFSALMQVIMILISYQKVFSFTHNDLHSNNIMYKSTNKKFIYYCYNKKYYKVPTFGRIFKIIDFGRSIYKYCGNIFCSDSFQNGGDAATQYNTEPYYDDKKARLEPNYSFDLCRLACSIFDYLVDDMDEIKNLQQCEPIVRLIVEWCLDDSGVNILYKNNGAERYPDFKLYKMIARLVHKHTPHMQLERPEFAAFLSSKPPEDKKLLINIDNLPCLSNTF